MNSDYLFSSPNSWNSSYPAHANNEEHQPQSFPNTKLPMFNAGIDYGMSNVGQASGSNAGQASGSNAGHLSAPRPRGRPRGSKNKPKVNVLNMTSAMKSAVLEIPAGFDVIEWLNQFAQSRNIFVNVIGGAGLISQVAYSHMVSQFHPVILAEQLTLISFSGHSGLISPSEPSGSCSFSATLGRLNGSVIGGTVWRLFTMGPVLVTVLISNNPEVIGADYKTLA